MDIRFGVVGEIVDDIYAGWYIFIQQYHNGEDTLVHTSSNFQTRLPNVKSYDTWIDNHANLEGQLEYWGITKINWREDLQSDLPPYANN